jgi:hypothetical protein
MAEFLKSIDIEDRIEKLISDASEFVYLISPYLYHIPPMILKRIKEADARGVKIVLIYKKGLTMAGKEVDKLNDISSLTIYSHEHLHAKAYFSEREAVITSYNLFSGEGGSITVDFGMCFPKEEQPDVYEQLVKDSQLLESKSKNMKLTDSKLVDEASLKPKPEKKYREVKVSVKTPASTPVNEKILTVKEKQKFIHDTFAALCPECQVKIEDGERMRVQGKGIVVFTSKERVEVIFVRYGIYQSRMEEVKQFIQSRHPDHGIWFNYNRITMSVDKASEISLLFPIIKEAITSLALV